MIYALKVIYIYHSPVVETLFMVLLCISLQLRDIMLVAGNQLGWEYLRHRNWEMLQIRDCLDLE